jgi:signal transduction histidine kinase
MDDVEGIAPLIAMAVRCLDGERESFTVAAGVNAEKLKDEILRPLIGRDEGLELVSAASTGVSWAFGLSGLMKAWAIQPTAEFLAEQRSIVSGQTMTYIGLTLIALVTLIGAAWFLVRVARRDIALAELKSNFVADVSHELKTPLALIRLFAETLQTGRIADEAKRQEYYAVIARESTRLTNLINNILDFARLEAGRRAYHFEIGDVTGVLRETYESYRPELDRHSFEHHFCAVAGLPRVRIDRDAMAQVLVNLMNNAVKYSSDEKYLLIDIHRDTRRGRHGVLISVEDRGIGIRPEDRARVFEGFFRAADGRVQGQGGTGLGLSLVKHTIEAHGGTMDVESRLVRGTAFRLFLPAAESERESMAAGREDGRDSTATTPGKTE